MNMLLKCTGRARGAWKTAATVLVLTGGQACGILDDGTCSLEDPPGILIEVWDAGSESPVPQSANPTGFAINGGVREPMTLVPPFPGAPTQLAGGWGPPGVRSEVLVYDVEITAKGYEAWRARGISVELDNCGQARTVEMTARLLPSTPTG